MKVIQYNIYFGNHKEFDIDDRIENICNIIINTNPDVICLQEVTREKYDMIKYCLIYHYPYSYPHNITFTYGSVIISKYKIELAVTHSYEMTQMGRDIKIVLVTDNNDNMFYICTTHFESEFKTVKNKIYQYKRCSDILYQMYIKTKIPIILCADTNVCKLTEYSFYGAFTNAIGWKDTWIETGSQPELEITFNTETNPILIEKYQNNRIIKSRLDRILHISDLYCNMFQMIGINNDIITSDHYGLVASFVNEKPDNYRAYIPLYISPLERIKDKELNSREKFIQKRYKKRILALI